MKVNIEHLSTPKSEVHDSHLKVIMLIGNLPFVFEKKRCMTNVRRN